MPPPNVVSACGGDEREQVTKQRLGVTVSDRVGRDMFLFGYRFRAAGSNRSATVSDAVTAICSQETFSWNTSSLCEYEQHGSEHEHNSVGKQETAVSPAPREARVDVEINRPMTSQNDSTCVVASDDDSDIDDVLDRMASCWNCSEKGIAA